MDLARKHEVSVRMRSILHIVLCVALSASAPWTHAGVMTVRAERPDWYKVVRGDTTWNITLDGEIDLLAEARVAEALTRAGRDGADVYINSPGGNLLVGMQIGRLLRKAGATTWIGTLKNDPASTFEGKPGVKHLAGYCYSACSLAFLGGIYRNVDKEDKYGVHRFSSSASPSDADLDTAQVISAAVGAYIREMDVDPGLFDYMVERGKDSIRILTMQELTGLNVVNNDRQKAEWSIEVVEGGSYLKGVQDTVFGRGKAVLLCQEHDIYFYSFYQAGSERAKSVAEGGWYHSLLVDGKEFPLPDSVRAKASGEEISAEFSLTKDQAMAIASSSSVGHAMQLGRDAPTFVGYQIDIPASASQKVGTFIRNCLTSVR